MYSFHARAIAVTCGADEKTLEHNKINFKVSDSRNSFDANYKQKVVFSIFDNVMFFFGFCKFYLLKLIYLLKRHCDATKQPLREKTKFL